MIRNLRLILAVFILAFVVGCTNETTVESTTIAPHTVNLYNSDDSLNETQLINHGETYSLPMISTSEEQLYVGWSDGITVYSGPITVNNDLELTLVEENVNDVFDIGEIYPEQDHVTIYNYVGSSKYLTIPKTINGLPVQRISSDSFTNSSLIEVYIPMSVRYVEYFAFGGSALLEKVVFYGEPYGIGQNQISAQEFNDFMDEHSEVCTIISEDEDGLITYAEGCPYISSQITAEIVVNDVTYINYQIIYHNSAYYEGYTQILYSGAFKDCLSLETVVMPKGGLLMFKEAFENTPKLINLEFDENNSFYQVIDNIVYSLDGTHLVYYPGGLTDTEFTIPESVTVIDYLAFASNVYLETVHIHANVANISYSSFFNLPALEEFTVDSDNTDYFAIDGVLYFNKFGVYLFRYPQNKLDVSFEIHEIVDYIGSNAFMYNQNLETIELGNKIDSIGSNAFDSVKKITILDIPSSVETLGYFFINLSSIEKIIIRRSSIVDGSITTAAGIIIRDRENIEVYLPDDSITDYMANYYWNYFYEQVNPLSEYTDEQ